MNDLIDKRKDYVTKGSQNISRYKAMKLFRKNELIFLNAYLMRFYIADEKYSAAETLAKTLTA